MSLRSSQAILNIEVLRNLLIFSPRAIVASLRAAACILGVAMLLSFPSARSHLYSQHFGATEIRQNIVRHTFVAGPESSGVEEIAHVDAQATIPAPVTVENVAKRLFLMPVVSIVPTFRILQHLKLGPSRSGASDPLL